MQEAVGKPRWRCVHGQVIAASLSIAAGQGDFCLGEMGKRGDGEVLVSEESPPWGA